MKTLKISAIAALILIPLVASCGIDEKLSFNPNSFAQSPASVEFISEDFCDGEVCLTLKVDCLGLASREAIVRTARNDAARGAVFFQTGGGGGGYYGGRPALSDAAPGGETVLALRAAGFETFEVSWQGQFGWAFDNPGAGLKAVMCAYAELLRWVTEDWASNGEVVGVTGNSGGSMQIGYSLAIHNLEEIVDVAVLSGGPPTSDAWDVCFGSGPRGEPAGGTSALMDHVFGWLDNGNYCQMGAGPDFAQEITRRESIVSDEPGEVRDFDHPNTIVSFVEGGQDQANIRRAEKYFNAITSAKTWDVLPDVPHAVHNNPDGAAKIRERMLEGLNAVEGDYALSGDYPRFLYESCTF